MLNITDLPVWEDCPYWHKLKVWHEVFKEVDESGEETIVIYDKLNKNSVTLSTQNLTEEKFDVMLYQLAGNGFERQFPGACLALIHKGLEVAQGKASYSLEEKKILHYARELGFDIPEAKAS